MNLIEFKFIIFNRESSFCWSKIQKYMFLTQKAKAFEKTLNQKHNNSSSYMSTSIFCVFISSISLLNQRTNKKQLYQNHF